MKHELIGPDGSLWRVQQLGAQVFTTEVDVAGVESETAKTHFDASAAQRAVAEQISSLRGQGWADSETTVRASAAQCGKAQIAAAIAADYHRLVSERPLSEALIEHFSFLAQDEGAIAPLRELFGAAHDAESDGGGLTIHFEGGYRLVCSGPSAGIEAGAPAQLRAVLEHHEIMWFYDDPTNDHRLCFGVGTGPPEGDAELSRTALEGHVGLWVLEEVPEDRYWLYHPSARNRHDEPALVCYEFDGGLHPPVTERIGTVLLQAMRSIASASSSSRSLR